MVYCRLRLKTIRDSVQIDPTPQRHLAQQAVQHGQCGGHQRNVPSRPSAYILRSICRLSRRNYTVPYWGPLQKTESSPSKRHCSGICPWRQRVAMALGHVHCGCSDARAVSQCPLSSRHFSADRHLRVGAGFDRPRLVRSPTTYVDLDGGTRTRLRAPVAQLRRAVTHVLRFSPRRVASRHWAGRPVDWTVLRAQHFQVHAEDVVRWRLRAEENPSDDDITRYDAPHRAANDSHRVSAATLPNITLRLTDGTSTMLYNVPPYRASN